MSAPLTVTALTRALKQAVEIQFGDIRVEGEIASFTAHRSGHWYFTLKDPRSVISAVMFRGLNQRLPWVPRVGERVIISGGLDIYAPHGKYNLIARTMERAGDGDLQRKLEELKARLGAEGLFEQARKRPLPAMPRAVGVATSGSGAAFHDIRKVLHRRFPGLTIYLAPCRVQGSGAPESIVEAIELLNRHGKSDVLIIGRGGGSREDLAAFSEELVARAIVSSAIPVVSAVGHEVDVSISDLVADMRAATPSHAAELVVPERDELAARLSALHQRLLWSARRDLSRRRQGLERIVVRHPERRIAEARLRCDELGDQLTRAAMWDLGMRKRRLAMATGKLEALSPLAVLARGYSLTLHEDRAVRSAAEVTAGDVVEIRLSEGRIRARVLE
jgi:exodeoxyribonuclease VII large subunit